MSDKPEESKEERQRMIQARAAFYKLEEEPILRDLRNVGVNVPSICNIRSDTPQSAIPVLLDHLAKPYDDLLRKFIAAALGNLKAKCCWEAIVEEYKKSDSKSHVKSGLAYAIKNIADASTIDQVLALARDRRHGTSRMILIDKLRLSKNPQVKQAILDLSDDPEIGDYIRQFMSKRRKPA